MVSKIFAIEQHSLPAFCLSGRLLEAVDGVVVHYFSACNVDSKNMFELDACYNLMLDLNRPKDEREFYMRDDRWPNERYYASAHYFIGRDGTIWQLTGSSIECYHAGTSMFNDRWDCNKWTIGIELIGHQYSQFSRDQYYALAQLLNDLEHQYRFPRTNVVGHDLVRHNAIEAGRKAKPKYDPTGRRDGQGDNFDWFYLGKIWNDIKPNSAGVATVDDLDALLAADPLTKE